MNAVLWDLDDTLVDSLAARGRALTAAYARCAGGRIDGRAVWQAHRGEPVERLAHQLVNGNYQQLVDSYREQYYEEARRVAAYPDVPVVLEALVTAGIPMLVVTSRVSWGATDDLQLAGLLQYFHSVVGYDDTDAHKPDPEPVFEAMDRLLIPEPETVLVVGDSAADIGAAQNAGCRSVGALWGVNESAPTTDAGPDFVAMEPFDVLRILRDEMADA